MFKVQKYNKMFGLFKKDPIKKLRKEYEQKLEEALNLQRTGDIKGFALKSDEAEVLAQKIAELEKKQ